MTVSSTIIDDWTQVTDILDVWFDSGCTHAFCLEAGSKSGKWDLKWPADVYLEGTDQHRGWFHSSLHGELRHKRDVRPMTASSLMAFVMADDGRKMSKSLGNQVFPDKIIKQYGAEILRLWVASSDYAEDLRIGQEVLKTNTRQLPQDAQHHPIPARQSLPFHDRQGYRRLQGSARA